MSLDPFGTTDNLLKFLDLAPNKLIEKFIEQHTQTSRDSTTSSSSLSTAKDDTTTKLKEQSMQDQPNLAYSTSKNSKATAFKWKKTMKSKDILKVQRVCKKPMRMLGYNPMTHISENKIDDSFPIIVKSSNELWSSKA